MHNKFDQKYYQHASSSRFIQNLHSHLSKYKYHCKTIMKKKFFNVKHHDLIEDPRRLYRSSSLKA